MGPNIYAARYRTPPGNNDWFWHGSIKHVHVHDIVLDPKDIFQELPVTVFVEYQAEDKLKGHCLILSGHEITMNFDVDTTLDDLRFLLETHWQGRPKVVLLNTQGGIFDVDMDVILVRDLPGIFVSYYGCICP